MTIAPQDKQSDEPASSVNWTALLTGLTFAVMIFGSGVMLMCSGLYGPEPPGWIEKVLLWVASIGMILLGTLIGGGTLLFCFLDRLDDAYDRLLHKVVDHLDPEGAMERQVTDLPAGPPVVVKADSSASGVIPAGRVRELLKVHGEVRSQDDSYWEGTVPLPEEIARFYREVGPVNILIPNFVYGIYLPSLSELWSQQKRYPGSFADESLWHRCIGKWLSQWQRDWIAVACESDNSTYVYAANEQHVVHVYRMHGYDGWWDTEIYPDLNTMAGCLAILGSVYVEAGGDDFENFMDDRGLIHPPSMLAAKSRLAAELGSESQVEKILGASGWE